ncbi:Fc.00g040320.m01.CDS01 [Cosmosporella sp. VM-42]
MDTLQEAARVATSKPVQRAVVNSVLLVSSAVSLFCLAGIASALFFQNFVPDQVVTIPVHLQYGAGLNPYGIVPLTTSPMKSQQEYDISMTLSMPRSPPNLERGNFMISLHLLDSKADDRLDKSARKYADSHEGFEGHRVLYSSRRPALFPYVDPVVSLASRVLFLFYHMLVPSSSTTTMMIPVAERVWFSKYATIPNSAYVEIEAGQSVQIYHATLSLTAQLRGLRWLMFHYRLPTYLAFTFLFWVFEIVFMAVAWTIWSALAGSAGDYGSKHEGSGRQAIKDTDESEGRGEESDRPETFPTYGRQPPLKYEPEVKQEFEDDQPLSELPVGGAEADDDSSEEDRRARDSGIGTSYSEGGGGSVRKRTSQTLMD